MSPKSMVSVCVDKATGGRGCFEDGNIGVLQACGQDLLVPFACGLSVSIITV